jgi:hypothetical protein
MVIPWTESETALLIYITNSTPAWPWLARQWIFNLTSQHVGTPFRSPTAMSIKYHRLLKISKSNQQQAFQNPIESRATDDPESQGRAFARLSDANQPTSIQRCPVDRADKTPDGHYPSQTASAVVNIQPSLLMPMDGYPPSPYSPADPITSGGFIDFYPIFANMDIVNGALAPDQIYLTPFAADAMEALF